MNGARSCATLPVRLRTTADRVRSALVGTMVVASQLLSSSAISDGGVVVARETSEGRRVTVFVAPAVPRVGVVEVSVLRSPAPSEPSSIVIVATSDHGGVERRAEASRAGGGNRMLESALLDLPFEGGWRVEVRCDDGSPSPSFRIEIAPALPPWRSQWPWLFAWLPLTVLLLVRERLAGRSRIEA